MEAFQQQTKDRLLHRMEAYVEESRSRQALEYLHGMVEFELPEEMVVQETQHHVNRIFSDSQHQGIDEASIMDQESEIIKAAEQMGRRDVKTKFLMNEIATS